MATDGPSRSRWLLTAPLKATFWLLVIALPLLGAWIGSSLAAYRNGPTWVPILCAVFAFPVLPLLWDLLGQWRFRRREAKRRAEAERVATATGRRIGGETKRFLTFSDRLVLRTGAVNLLFVGILLGWFPENVFTALSTRGDWFLERDSPWAERARGYLFTAADQLEWLWELTHDNPFAEETPEPTPEPPDPGSEVPQPEPPPTPEPGDDPKDEDPETDGAAESDDDEPDRSWPFGPELHPAVASMPSSAEESISSVAGHLSEQESDPFLLVKALHDYVADRIAYDAPSYAAGKYPSQDPRRVFDSRLAVCAGYAKLLRALGKAAGVEIVYLAGQSRDSGGDVDGQGHAWNAARIEGDWYLIDATWDAGYVEGSSFTKRYTSDYLMTPPEVFGLNHLPRDPKWQLRDEPISRGEFMRQPNVRPMLYAKGFELIEPDRSQVTVDGGDLAISLRNLKNKSLLVRWLEKGSGRAHGKPCRVDDGERTRASCALPGHGTYHVKLFVGDHGTSPHWYAGQFEVNHR